MANYLSIRQMGRPSNYYDRNLRFSTERSRVHQRVECAHNKRDIISQYNSFVEVHEGA